MPFNISNKILQLVFSSALIVAANNTQGAKTSLITASSENLPSSGTLYKSALSADGRYVAFSSNSEKLVASNTFNSEIFLRDRTKNKTILISLGANGEPAEASSREATISANGRFVAFSSDASNLVARDIDNKTDIFVFDRVTKLMICVSCSASALLSDSESSSPSISADGRLVAFVSKGWNGSNYKSAIFVHDRQKNKITLVSLNSAGAAGDQDSDEPFISANGRFVAFSSWASNLAPGIANETYGHHVYVRDLQEKKTIRVSVNSDGLPGDNYSTSPSLSADGRFVAFASGATNLVANDTGFNTDIFVHDQLTGKTKRISVDSSGNQGNANSHFTELNNPWIIGNVICACETTVNIFAIGSGGPSISANGRFVAFDSYASNLVAEDKNADQDVFLHDRNTGRTRRISIDSRGQESIYGSGFPSMSADGRVVVFASKGNITNYSYTNPEGMVSIWSAWLENIYAKDIYLNTTKNTDIELAVTTPPHSCANNIVESTLVN